MKSTLGVEMVDHGKLYYLKQEWDNGDLCELSGLPRKTFVEYYCDQEEKIHVSEPATCQYKLIVTTPKLCYDSGFVRQKDALANKIHCKPRDAVWPGQTKRGPLILAQLQPMQLATAYRRDRSAMLEAKAKTKPVRSLPVIIWNSPQDLTFASIAAVFSGRTLQQIYESFHDADRCGSAGYTTAENNVIRIGGLWPSKGHAQNGHPCTKPPYGIPPDACPNQASGHPAASKAPKPKAAMQENGAAPNTKPAASKERNPGRENNAGS
ncbi:hypothetical protein HDU91_004003 [Kappamyces sp. JEL0680]|nr:hypothetical protein HDU91_004003 [Kappamyces sp. JEL0680]